MPDGVLMTAFTRINPSKIEAGSHLLSHTVSSAVPSAAYVLTIVFGMGTGVTRKRIATSRFLEVLSPLNTTTTLTFLP